MILTCPSCGTRYQADGARLGAGGGNVRCAKCGHVWFQRTTAAEETEPEPETVARVAEAAAEAAAVGSGGDVPAFTAMDAPLSGQAEIDFLRASTMRPRPDARAKRPARAGGGGTGFAISAAWAALFLILAALGWSMVRYRQAIADVWPQTASLYAALGMPVNVRGLTIEDVHYSQDVEDGQPVLSITGRVVNITNRDLAVPELHVSLSDTEKRELYHWNFDVGVPMLKAGASSPFVTRLTSPPPNARAVEVRFAQNGETQ